MPPVPAELVHGVDSWAWRGPFNRVPLPLPHPGLSGRECSVESRLQISEEANPNPWSLSLALGFPVPTEAGKRRERGGEGRGGGQEPEEGEGEAGRPSVDLVGSSLEGRSASSAGRPPPAH